MRSALDVLTFLHWNLIYLLAVLSDDGLGQRDDLVELCLTRDGRKNWVQTKSFLRVRRYGRVYGGVEFPLTFTTALSRTMPS